MSAAGTGPRIARRLLTWALPADQRDHVVADLDEVYERQRERLGGWHARMWYWREVAAFTFRFGIERLVESPAVHRIASTRFGRHASSELVRVRQGAPVFSWLDLKLAARRLVKHWPLTVVGGLAMTVAISVGAVVFGVLSEIGGGRLPLDEGDRIVAIQTIDASLGGRQNTAFADLERWRATTESLRDLGAFQTVQRNLIVGEGLPVPVTVAEMSASGFDLARIPPLLGRPLVEADGRADAAPVVVLGYDLWQSRFGADPAVVGSEISLGETVYSIAGVMPEGFAFPLNNQIWTPLRRERDSVLRTSEAEEGVIFARLAPGASLETANAELQAAGLLPRAGDTADGDRRSVRVVPYTNAFAGEGEWWILRMMAVLLGLVLVPPCTNLAILIYARTMTRQGEFAAGGGGGARRPPPAAASSVSSLSRFFCWRCWRAPRRC